MTFREEIKARIERDLGPDFYLKSRILKKFRITAKSEGILCGMIFLPTIVEVVEKEFFLKPFNADFPVKISLLKFDGDRMQRGDIIAELYGNSEVLLKAERHILFMLSRLSGIATHVAKRVEEVAGTGVFLLDTRKDDPLSRPEDKYAVRLGGAKMHRSGFFDGTLIKDNDIAVFGGVKGAIDERLKLTKFLTKVEIEVSNLEELEKVLRDDRVDVILLDNMSPAMLREAVNKIRASGKKYLVEASGIGDHALSEIAKTEVDCISLSSLVDGAKKLDISMKVAADPDEDELRAKFH